MSLQDPISDMLTRIRNAQMVNKKKAVMPSSKLKVSLCKVLLDEGYIQSYVVDGAKKPELTILLKYYDGKAVIDEIKRYSKPGLRRYASKNDLPKVRDGLGISIISTSRGVMSDRRARDLGVGGEVLCTLC